VIESRRRPGELYVRLAGDADVDAFLNRARSAHAHVVSVIPYHQTLEDVFMRKAMDDRGSEAQAS
jgi:hypothetical protein